MTTHEQGTCRDELVAFAWDNLYELVDEAMMNRFREKFGVPKAKLLTLPLSEPCEGAYVAADPETGDVELALGAVIVKVSSKEVADEV